MRLISPSGVRISVADQRAESLLKQGYRVLGADTVSTPSSEPAEQAAPKPVRRTRRASR